MELFGKEVNIEEAGSPYITLSMVLYSDVMQAVEALTKYEPHAEFLLKKLTSLNEERLQQQTQEKGGEL